MVLDIRKAFKFPFTESGWAQKLIIGGVFYLILNLVHGVEWFLRSLIASPDMLSFSGFSQMIKITDVFFSLFMAVLSIAITAFPIGYVIQSIHNEVKNEPPLLPEWESNFTKYFKNGIYFYLINILYAFIILTISSIPLLIGLSIFNLYKGFSFISFQGIGAAVLFTAPLVIFYIFISPFIYIAYAENFNIQDAFRLDKILTVLSRNIPDYLASIGLTIILYILLTVLSVFLVCTCIGIVFLPFLTLPSLLITFNLFSQTYKQAKASV